MKALLRKDFYVLKNQARAILIIALVFSLVPGMEGMGGAYAAILAVMLPLSTITYDEKSRWDKYAAMLPYKPAQIVGSKYILFGIAASLAAVLVVLGKYMQSAIREEAFSWLDISFYLVLEVMLLWVMTTVSLPLMYRFGAEKGRIVMSCVLLGVLGALAALITDGGQALVAFLERIPLVGVMLAVFALMIGWTVLSFRLSVWLYVKRRNGAYT